MRFGPRWWKKVSPDHQAQQAVRCGRLHEESASRAVDTTVPEAGRTLPEVDAMNPEHLVRLTPAVDTSVRSPDDSGDFGHQRADTTVRTPDDDGDSALPVQPATSCSDDDTISCEGRRPPSPRSLPWRTPTPT